MQTGAEVAWAASNSFLSDPAAMKILLSGISTVSAAATVLGLVAWLVHAKIYHWTGLGLQAIRDLFSGSYRARYTLLGVPNKSWMRTLDLRTVRRIAITVSICSSLLFLELTRPSVPYDHLSGALPLTLLDAFTKKSSTTEGCRQAPMKFPLWTDVKTGFMANSWSRPSWLPRIRLPDSVVTNTPPTSAPRRITLRGTCATTTNRAFTTQELTRSRSPILEATYTDR